MNAIAPILQFQPSNDVNQFKPTDSLDLSTHHTDGQDFGSAMDAAGSKPVRKSTSAKSSPQGRGGKAPPAGGNQSPAAAVPSAAVPPALPPVAAPPATAPITAGPTANPAPPPSAASGASTVATAPAPPAPPATALPPATLSPHTEAAPGNSTTSPFAQLIGQAATDAMGSNAAAPEGATKPTAPAVPSAPLMPNAAAKTTAAGSAAAPVVVPTPKAAPVAATNGATHAGRDTPTANSTSTSGSDAVAATDTAAQAAMAAAAATRGANGSAHGDTAPTFLGASDSASAPTAQAPAVASPVVPAVADAHGAVAQAVAVAASNTKAITELAGVSVDSADKPSHSSASLDLSITGSSNDGSAGAAQLLSGTASADATPAPTFKIPTPVESTDFSQGVADRVSFMVDGNISSAKLQVNPAALGPIEVRIALQGAHAQVSFTSHSALTRDALESSAPKLREMLSAQGFGQVSVDVSQGGSSQDRAAQSSAYQASSSTARSSAVSAVQSVASASPRAAAGVVDAYA